VRIILACVLAALLTAQVPPAPAHYEIDLGRYFASPQVELQSRATVLADAASFVNSATPVSAPSFLRWLQRFDGLLKALKRHDIYLYLCASQNDRDDADANAEDSIGDAYDLISDRVDDAARQLGKATIQRLTLDPSLRAYQYLLLSSLDRSAHQLSPQKQQIVDAVLTPVLDSASATYKRMRKAGGSLENGADAYAALLVSIASARNGLARLRGFHSAAEAAYFDRTIDPASVQRTLDAVRGSHAYANYLTVAARAQKPAYNPPVVSIADAIPSILAAEAPMGDQYASAYKRLLDSSNRRLEICSEPECDDDGFSVGFAGSTSGVYYGGYDGRTHAVRAVAHESGHAVHRQFMNEHQPIAAYNRGPSFMFESFAIFNELLFLDGMYRSAPNQRVRAYYLNYFLDDATFQVFGSAEETDLEASIYRGIDNGSIRTFADLEALSKNVFAKYDPRSVNDPATPLYWAADRLYFTDPLYDVNYLYAGLLALTYFQMYERDPQAFAPRYVALLKNGFNDSPAALLQRFLSIDLTDERGLVTNAASVIDRRTQSLDALYRQ
jgi:oligoendopeptidase F